MEIFEPMDNIEYMRGVAKTCPYFIRHMNVIGHCVCGITRSALEKANRLEEMNGYDELLSCLENGRTIRIDWNYYRGWCPWEIIRRNAHKMSGSHNIFDMEERNAF